MSAETMNLPQFEKYVAKQITANLFQHYHADTYFAFTIENMDGKMLTLGTKDQKVFASRSSHGYIQMPSIPLLGIYQEYIHGMDVDKMVHQLSDSFISTLETPVDMNCIFNYGFVKDHMFIVCLNRKQHYKTIRSLPHSSISDFALICCISIEQNEMETVHPVTYKLLKKYGITAEQLFQDALKSTTLIKPVKIKNINDLYEEGIIRCRINGEYVESLHPKEKDIKVNDIFALIQTDDIHYGASELFYPGVLEQVSSLLNDHLILIPHSKNCFVAIAERVISKDDYALIKTEFRRRNSLNPNLLSNSIYHYSKIDHVFESMDSYISKQEKKMIRSFS